MTRTAFETAREAAMIERLALRLRHEAARSESRTGEARVTMSLYALADALDADADAIADDAQVTQ